MGISRLKLWRMSLPVLICLLGGGGLFAFPTAQPTAAATNGYSISGGTGPNTRPSVAISPDSAKVCAVWTTYNNSPDHPYARIYTVANQSWSPDLSQAAFDVSRGSDGGTPGNTVRCAIDAAGRTHVVWTENPDARLRYSMLHR